MPENGTKPTLEQQIQWLQNELNDSHLVIGRQQVQLLQQAQGIQQMQIRIMELEAELAALRGGEPAGVAS